MPNVCLTTRSSAAVETLWERMLSGRGLCHRGSLREKKAGDTFSIETAAGDIFVGTVAAHEPLRELTLVVQNMHDSVIHLTLDALGGEAAETQLEFSLVAIGLHHDEVDSFRSRWRMQLNDLFAGALTSG